MKEIVESYNLYISKVAPGCLNISELLRDNQIEEANKQILFFTEGMDWLINASDVLKKTKINVDFDYEKILAFFQEINQGIELNDFFSVADIFEYEIAEFFNQLKPIEFEEN